MQNSISFLIKFFNHLDEVRDYLDLMRADLVTAKDSQGLADLELARKNLDRAEFLWAGVCDLTLKNEDCDGLQRRMIPEFENFILLFNSVVKNYAELSEFADYINKLLRKMIRDSQESFLLFDLDEMRVKKLEDRIFFVKERVV